MTDNVYSVTEVVGTSSTSIEDAIERAVATASPRHLDWFEVVETRGHIVNGKVGHYQVHVKLGIRYDHPIRPKE